MHPSAFLLLAFGSLSALGCASEVPPSQTDAPTLGPKADNARELSGSWQVPQPYFTEVEVGCPSSTATADVRLCVRAWARDHSGWSKFPIGDPFDLALSFETGEDAIPRRIEVPERREYFEGTCDEWGFGCSPTSDFSCTNLELSEPIIRLVMQAESIAADSPLHRDDSYLQVSADVTCSGETPPGGVDPQWCGGEPTACDSFSDASCGGLDYCRPVDGCRGTPAFPCSAWDSDSRECGRVPGCYFRSDSCRGRPDSCEDLSVNSCEDVPGCSPDFVRCSGSAPVRCSQLSVEQCTEQPGCQPE